MFVILFHVISFIFCGFKHFLTYFTAHTEFSVLSIGVLYHYNFIAHLALAFFSWPAVIFFHALGIDVVLHTFFTLLVIFYHMAPDKTLVHISLPGKGHILKVNETLQNRIYIKTKNKNAIK